MIKKASNEKFGFYIILFMTCYFFTGIGLLLYKPVKSYKAGNSRSIEFSYMVELKVKTTEAVDVYIPLPVDVSRRTVIDKPVEGMLIEAISKIIRRSISDNQAI